MLQALASEADKWLKGHGVRPGKSVKASEEVFLTDTRKKHKKQKQKKKKSCEEEEDQKKASMKTATDVIKRILWDEKLDKDDFLVGYLDRFKGIVEKYFSAFSWEDIASVDYDVLAVPKHRIQYFKYRKQKIWDKPSRMDNVFGSTGSGITVYDVINNYQEGTQGQTEGEAQAEAGDGESVNGDAKVPAGDAEVDVGDSDSDSDDGITVTIGTTVNTCPPGQNRHDGGDVDEDAVNDGEFDPYWQDKLRPNYFLALRITDPEIRQGVEQIQDYLLDNEPLVVYAKVKQHQGFMDFVDHVKLLVKEAGLEIRDNHDFVPHMTIMKVTRPVARQKVRVQYADARRALCGSGVREACCQFLEKQLDSTNCLGIKIFAERHGCTDLWAAADRFSVRHFQDVVTQEEYRSLPLDEVEALVKSDHLQVNSEEPVYQAVIDWVKNDEKNRVIWLPGLLQFVRLPLLSARFITDVIDCEPLIKSNHACRDLVDEAKRFHLRPDLRCRMNGPRTNPRIGTDDQLVVVGGFGSHQNLVDVVEKYDPKTHTWARLPSLSRRRRYVSAASVGGKLYVMGGYDGHSRLNLVECLDLTQSQLSWATISAMHHRRGLAGVCVYKDCIYMCGGFDGHTRHTSMERYDPKTDKWTMLSGMAIGREGAGLVVAGDMIYCIGGYDGINLLDSAEQFDPASEQWKSIPCMSTQRSGAGVAVVNEVIYVCGGYDGSDHLSSVECFNTQTNHWTTLQHMVVPRCYVGACVLRGQLMVVAG
nr:hypothetical protein BaRGS_026223 [Batillaria attramentaria]